MQSNFHLPRKTASRVTRLFLAAALITLAILPAIFIAQARTGTDIATQQPRLQVPAVHTQVQPHSEARTVKLRG